MPGPFPGVDPYIEDDSAWSTVYLSLVVALNTAINKKLSGKYWCRIGQRGVLDDVTHDGLTGFASVATPSERMRREKLEQSGIDAPILIDAMHDGSVARFVQIVRNDEERQVLTEIELLNPKSKVIGSRSRTDYLERQTTALNRGFNFIEIDLLRIGTHVSAFPRRLARPDSSFDYSVCLHRANDRFKYEVWAWSLRDKLPRIAVPIEHGVDDLALNLQELFDCCYDESYFGRLLNYRKPLNPPLSAEDAAWVNQLLKKKSNRQ